MRVSVTLLAIALAATRASFASPQSIVQQAYIKALVTDSHDEFGSVIAAHGDVLVVGAQQEDSLATGVNGDAANDGAWQSGAAYVFRLVAGSWIQEAYLKASNTDPGDGFGGCVAVSGDTIAIAASGEQSSSTGINGAQGDNSAPYCGAVYVFRLVGSSWRQEAYLKASNAEAGDFFGRCLALDGDTLAVCATEDSGSPGVGADESDNSAESAGAVYLFERTGTTWTQQAYLKSSAPDRGDRFGTALALEGDRLVVGAYNEDSASAGMPGNPFDNSLTDAGSAYVFERTGGTWTQSAYLKPLNPGQRDWFGASVDLFADTIVVASTKEGSDGACHSGDPDNEGMFSSGAAYVFREVAGTWTQEAFIKPPRAVFTGHFGSVALQGETLAVGHFGENGPASGINADPAAVGPDRTGAVHLYRRRGSAWRETAYLKAASPGDLDYFGRVTALTPEHLFVGAPREDSSASGVNGDDTNDDLGQSGAAFVFDLVAGGPGTSYCFGTACPCGNNDQFGGCSSVAGFGGVLVATGSASVASDDLVLATHLLPTHQFALTFMGASQTSLPFGNGLRCAAGVTHRFNPPRSSDSCGRIQVGPGLAFSSCTTFGPSGCIASGGSWNFQTWFRDPGGVCGSSFNTSNAVSVAFIP